MEPKPKERIVFDEDSYYGDEGAEWAVNDLMERKGLTEDEVRESFTDDEVFQHAMKLRDFDYEEEMRALTAFFDGKKSDMSDFINPYGGNHIFVAGSVERWDDTIPVITVYKDFDAATDCSPSRFGRGNVFADCEIQKVWDENGTLYLAGADLDGLEAYGFAYPLSTQAATDWLEGDDLAKVNAFLKETCKEVFGILPGADDGGYSLSGEAKEAALSRFALPENRKAALNMIRKLNESRDSNDNAL